METFTVKSNKGEVIKFGIRKQYDMIPFKFKPLGVKWTILWQAYGYKASGYHREEWFDFLEDKKPEQVIDDIRERFGHGHLWGFYEEIITRA